MVPPVDPNIVIRPDIIPKPAPPLPNPNPNPKKLYFLDYVTTMFNQTHGPQSQKNDIWAVVQRIQNHFVAKNYLVKYNLLYVPDVKVVSEPKDIIEVFPQ